MARLSPGDAAPDFALESDDGGTIRLSDLAGTRVVLYFYPKDDTTGCTAQACEYRDLNDDFTRVGARVLGVSPDPLALHERFRRKYDLNFTLLSDPDHAAAEAYGVWVEKSMYGRTYMGVERSAFVIGPDGVVERALYKVKAKGNAADVLAGLAG
ncbi:MAG: thioredoxin-dependent thiol peroxidase [Actinomycetota bacterium]